MSSANYKTSRDLFLTHHWLRYVSYDQARDEGFRCGRLIHKTDESIRLLIQDSPEEVTVVSWSKTSLREPRAAESAPSVHEVLAIGDWVGVNHLGEAILYAACGAYMTTPNALTCLQSGEQIRSRAHAWADFLTRVRNFFESHSFLEMTTPSLAPSPGTEPFLDPLSVVIESDGLNLEKYLITSPEFHLKKALAAGLPRIFEIAKCYRNREGGPHHRVEFHMLEWYRSFASLHEISQDVVNLIGFLSPETRMRFTTMPELFKRQIDIELSPAMSRDELNHAAAFRGVRTTSDDSFNDIFHRIFLERIEPHLSEISSDEPLLISDYPPSMAALARIGSNGYADRFEVYWRGLEICNAFHELNDPVENRRRFESDNAEREYSGRKRVPLDEELLLCFDLGLPPAGGIALGLERLFMVIHDLSEISKVRPFLS